MISLEGYYHLQLLINIASHLATTLKRQQLSSLAAIIFNTNCVDYNSDSHAAHLNYTFKAMGSQVLTRLRALLLRLLRLSTLLDYHNTEGTSATNPLNTVWREWLIHFPLEKNIVFQTVFPPFHTPLRSVVGPSHRRYYKSRRKQ